jgi:hypothetical protein
MQSLSRRHMFGLVPGAALVALTAGCATTKVGNTTTLTINVAKIDAYVEAAINGANTVLLIVKQFPTLSSFVMPISKLVTLIAAAGYAFNQATDGKLSIEYNDASAMTAINSIFNLVGQLAGMIGDVITAMGAAVIDQSIVDRIEITYSAVKTLVSIIKAVISADTAYANPASYQGAEVKALRTLNA